MTIRLQAPTDPPPSTLPPGSRSCLRPASERLCYYANCLQLTTNLKSLGWIRQLAIHDRWAGLKKGWVGRLIAAVHDEKDPLYRVRLNIFELGRTKTVP
jgi:hypothetical protein